MTEATDAEAEDGGLKVEETGLAIEEPGGALTAPRGTTTTAATSTTRTKTEVLVQLGLGLFATTPKILPNRRAVVANAQFDSNTTTQVAPVASRPGAPASGTKTQLPTTRVTTKTTTEAEEGPTPRTRAVEESFLTTTTTEVMGAPGTRRAGALPKEGATTTATQHGAPGTTRLVLRAVVPLEARAPLIHENETTTDTRPPATESNALL